MVRQKLYECPAGCGKVYISFQGMKEHKKVHGVQYYACNFDACSKIFKWRSSYTTHLRTHKAGDKKTVRTNEYAQVKRRGREALSDLNSCSVAEKMDAVDTEQSKGLKTNQNKVIETKRTCPPLQELVVVYHDIREVGDYVSDSEDDLYLFNSNQTVLDFDWEM